jgi:hypothetical protein
VRANGARRDGPIRSVCDQASREGGKRAAREVIGGHVGGVDRAASTCPGSPTRIRSRTARDFMDARAR